MAINKSFAKNYKVIVNTGKTEDNKTLDVTQGAGDRGQPLRIRAQAGAKYQLQEIDKAKSAAPEYVKVKRVGKDLHITFENDDAADLIIEDYYSVMPEGYNGVIGKAESGAFYEYVPEDPSVKGLIPELVDGGQGVNVALGGQEVQGTGAALAVFAFTPLLGALGLAGAAAAVAANSGASTNNNGTSVLAPANDTGVQGDGITNNPSPTINGTVPAGSTAVVSINGKDYPVTVNPDGTYSYTIPDKLPDGTYTPVIKVTQNGTTTSTIGTPFTVDTTAASIAITSDKSGLLAGQTATITFTLSEASTDFTEADVQVTGGTLSNFTGSGGVYTATFTPAGTGSVATISVASGKFADAAANFNTDGAEANNTVTLSTNAATSGALSAGTDTGVVGDNITSNPKPVISGKVPAGSTATVTINGVTQPVAVNPDGSYSYTQPSNLPDGTYTPVLNVTTNGATTASNLTPFTVDTTVPNGGAAVGLTIDVDTSNDGAINTTEKGAATTTSLTATFDNTKVVAGDSVTFSDGTTTKVVTLVAADISAGKVSSTGWTLPAEGGTLSVTAVLKDAAGNATLTATDSAKIDTTAPTQTVAINSISLDSGTAGDFITNDNNGLTVNATLSAALGVGEKLMYSRDNGVTWIDVSSSVTGTVVSYVDASLTSTNTVKFKVSDISGNDGASASQLVTIDTTAPAVPATSVAADDVGAITGAITTGSTTDDTQPTFSGTGTPGDTIKIYDGATLIGSGTVGSDGKYSITPTTPLTSGPHSVTTTASDPAGNESAKSAPLAFTVAGAAPSAPAITAVTDNAGSVTGTLQKGQTTDDATLDVSGTGTAGATVKVYEGVTLVGSTTVKADGTWSLTTSNLGVDGTKNLTAVASDNAGQTSPATGVFNVVLDTAAAAKPAISTATDDVGAVTGPIAAGSTTDDTQPTFSGTGTPGDVVKVYDGPTLIGTGSVGADGKYSVTPTVPLSNGAHTITTTQTDPAGNTSPASDPLSFTVDTSAVVVSITKAIDNVGTTADVAKAGLTNDNTPTLVGTATPNAVVTISEGSTIYGTTTADASGAWSFTPAVQVGGAHTYTATAKNAAGTQGSDTFALTIDTDAPAAPLTPTSTDDVGAQQGVIANNGTTDDTQPTFAGTGTPGELVKVYDGTTVIGTATVAADGKWSVTPTAPLSEGTHAITTTATDAAGNESAKSPALNITIDTTAPAVPVSAPASYADDVGAVQSTASTAATTDDSKPGIQVGAGLTDTPKLYVDGVAVPATYNAATGTLTPTTALADGPHAFTYTLTDAAGNESAKSPALNITIDTTVPTTTTAAVTAINDNVGLVTGVVGSGGVTDDTQVSTSGTLSAALATGEVVRIYDGATYLGNATLASGATTWTYNDTRTLSNAQTVSYTARVADAAGNQSAAGSAYSATVDTTAPTQTVAINSISLDSGTAGDFITNDNNGLTVNATLSAALGAGEKLMYSRDNGTNWIDVSSSVTGTVVSYADANLTSTNTVKFKVMDAAGNNGVSASQLVTIDNTVPTIAVTAPVQHVAAGGNTTVTFTLSEASTNFISSDVTVTGGALSNWTAVSPTVYTATFTATESVAVARSVSVAGGVFSDAAGNTNAVGSAVVLSLTMDTITTIAYNFDGTTTAGSVVTIDANTLFTTPNTAQRTASNAISNVDKTGDADSEFAITPLAYSTGTAAGYNVNQSLYYKWVAQAMATGQTTSAFNAYYRFAHSATTAGQMFGFGNSWTETEDSTQAPVHLTQGLTVEFVGKDTIAHGNAAAYGVNKIIVWWNGKMLAQSAAGVDAWSAGGTEQAVSITVNSLGQVTVTNSVGSASGTYIDHQQIPDWATTSMAGWTYFWGGNSGNGTTSAANVGASWMDDMAIKIEKKSTGSPLVIDLNGDGVQTTSLEAGVRFDLSAQGTAQQTAWLDKHDGILVMDLNHDGQINNGSEMFGNNTPLANGAKAADGWQALAQYDVNGDGMVDAQDAGFAEMRVWVDANGDGVTDKGELHTLQDVGIQSLNLAHTADRTAQNGNILDGQGSVNLSNGSTAAMTDAWLQIQPVVQLDLSQVTPTMDSQGHAAVNMTDGTFQTLKLDVSDVLAQYQSTLVVTGDSQDAINLTNLTQWTHQANSVAQDGHVYDVWTLGQAQLLIDHQMLMHAAV